MIRSERGTTPWQRMTRSPIAAIVPHGTTPWQHMIRSEFGPIPWQRTICNCAVFGCGRGFACLGLCGENLAELT